MPLRIWFLFVSLNNTEKGQNVLASIAKAGPSFSKGETHKQQELKVGAFMRLRNWSLHLPGRHQEQPHYLLQKTQRHFNKTSWTALWKTTKISNKISMDSWPLSIARRIALNKDRKEFNIHNAITMEWTYSCASSAHGHTVTAWVLLAMQGNKLLMCECSCVV